MFFLGRDFGKPREHSEQTQEDIDTEVRRILEEQFDKARSILRENLETLHRLAKAVRERETLDAEDIEKIMKGEALPPVEGIASSTDGNGKPDGAADSEGKISITA